MYYGLKHSQKNAQNVIILFKKIKDVCIWHVAVDFSFAGYVNKNGKFI